MPPRPSTFLPLLLATPLLACADDAAGPPVASTGDYTALVQRGWTMPTSATDAFQVGFDLDDDGRPDNAIGSLIGSLANLGLEVDVANAELLGSGDPIVAHVLRSDGLTDDTSVAWQLWRSAGTPPRFDGTDRVVADVIDGALWGELRAGTLSARWGDAVARVPLFPGQPPVLIALGAAQVELAVDGPCRGRLGGVVDAAAMTVALEEVGRQTLAHMQAHPEHAFTAAATEFMDADRDGVVTVPEVVALAHALLAADVEGDRGRAYSFALAFECAPARLVATPAFE